MTEYYEYSTFQDRHPGLHMLGLGIVIGMLSAVAVSSAIALAQFREGAPWELLLDEWWKMLVLTIPVASTAFGAAFLAYYYRRSILPPAPPPSPEAIRPSVVITPSSASSIAEQVVQNAKDQARTYYQEGIEPTRQSFGQAGVSQVLWNSSRYVLTTAKIVGGNQWAQEPWEAVEKVLSRIHSETDRIWVPVLNSRGEIKCLHIREQALNKRLVHPTPQGEEPKRQPEQTVPLGSGSSDGFQEM